MNDETLNKWLHIRLTENDKSKIKEIAEWNDCSVSETLRFMLVLAHKSQLWDEYGWTNKNILLDNEE